MSSPSILDQFYAAQRKFSRPENRKGIKLSIKDVPVSVTVPLYPEALDKATLVGVGKRVGCKSSSRHEMEDGVTRAVPAIHGIGKEGEGMVSALFSLATGGTEAPAPKGTKGNRLNGPAAAPKVETTGATS